MKNQQRTCRIPAHLVWLAAVALLTAACASIGNPSGGARDEQPPRFVRANPAPYATDVPVTIEKINIDFDELINVKDAFSKVVVSPPSKSVPRVASQGHRVTVTFSDTLLENTTYTINFADAIEDNNEANPLENFSYTFSTGPYVDSLRIAGRVLSAQAMEPMQGKIVGVHRLADAPADSLASAIAADSIAAREQAVVDSIVFRRQFDRVARTDDRGRFSIEGLAPGRYRVFALDDANTDYIYSSPDEEFAFYEEVVEPYALPAVATDTIYNLKLGTIDSITTRQRSIFYPNDLLLRSFLTSRKQQYITNYQRQDSTRLNLTFNAPNSPLPEISLVGATDLKDWYIMERSAKGDSLTLWLKSRGLVSNDTLRMAISYLKPDSLNRYVATNDTLRFTTDRPRKPKADNKKKKDAQADTLPPPSHPSAECHLPRRIQPGAHPPPPLHDRDTPGPPRHSRLPTRSEARHHLDAIARTPAHSAGFAQPQTILDSIPMAIRHRLPTTGRLTCHGGNLRTLHRTRQPGIQGQGREGVLLADTQCGRLARRSARLRRDCQHERHPHGACAP